MKFLFSCTMSFLAFSIFGSGPAGFGQQPTSTSLVGIQRGARFSDREIPSRDRVSEVDVFSDGSYICAVEMQFSLSDGRIRMGPRHGGSCGQQNSFHLDLDEYIVGLSGRYDSHIDSMRIHTNKRTSPLFGSSGGTQEYRIDVDAGNQAVGFLGRSDRYLNAIGLNFVPVTILQAGQTLIVGGNGGTAFSDPEVPRGARISEVRVRSGEMVNSIQAVYTLGDGRLLEGPVHGGEEGTLSVFQLDPNEYLVGFSGTSEVHINSILIRTNRRTSQIFGESRGNNIFSINVPAGNQAIGIRGRADKGVDAIGLNYASINKSPRGKERSHDRR